MAMMIAYYGDGGAGHGEINLCDAHIPGWLYICQHLKCIGYTEVFTYIKSGRMMKGKNRCCLPI